MLSILENGIPQPKKNFLGTATKIGAGVLGTGLAAYGGYKLGQNNGQGPWSFSNVGNNIQHGWDKTVNWYKETMPSWMGGKEASAPATGNDQGG